MLILLVPAALLGLAVGSFLNVVIYRVPQGMSVVRPASHCPGCDRPIRARHNVPVLGWLLLRGRCADCHTPIPVRYPLVELATGALFVAVTARLLQLHREAALPAYLLFAAGGLALAMIDLDCKRLPNAIVLPGYPVLGVALLAAAAVQHDGSAAVRTLLGGVGLYVLYFALAFAYPAGMGFGDVKLAGLVGAVTAFVSLPTLLVGAFSAFLLGGIAGIAVLAAGRGGRKTAIPFGPFMIAGALLGLFAAQPISDLYLRLALGR